LRDARLERRELLSTITKDEGAKIPDDRRELRKPWVSGWHELIDEWKLTSGQESSTKVEV